MKRKKGKKILQKQNPRLSDRLSWASDLKNLDSARRQKLVDEVLSTLKESSREGDKRLYRAIIDGGYELVGIQPFLVYDRIKEIEGPEDLEADWVHQWGFPTLIYGHPKSSHLLIVNPWIRVSNSVVNELDGNSRVSIAKGQVTG